MEEMICSFFGHRKIDVSEALNEKLEQAVKKRWNTVAEPFTLADTVNLILFAIRRCQKLKEKIRK